MGGRSTLHGDAKGLREMFNGLMAALAPSMPPPDDQVTHEDMSADGVSVRIHKPKNASGKLPLGVFYHSGGYVVGNLDSEGSFCDFLAHHAAGNGCVIVNVDYRLAPEAKSPAQFDDCMKAWKWAVSNVDSIGGDKDKMFIAGGSAGGCLSLAVTAALVGDESTRNQVKGCMALVPATVHEDNMPKEWQSLHTSYVDNEEAPVIDRKSMQQFYGESSAVASLTLILANHYLWSVPLARGRVGQS